VIRYFENLHITAAGGVASLGVSDAIAIADGWTPRSQAIAGATR